MLLLVECGREGLILLFNVGGNKRDVAVIAAVGFSFEFFYLSHSHFGVGEAPSFNETPLEFS